MTDKEAGFEMWPQLAAGKHVVGDMPLCRVLLNDDKTWPWLVLVPRREGMVEMHDLDEEDQAQLMREMSECAKATRRGWNPTKVNVAAIGCVCRQLHVHVLGRYEGDACWPGPVWGATEPVPYAERDLGVALAKFRRELGSHISPPRATTGTAREPSRIE